MAVDTRFQARANGVLWRGVVQPGTVRGWSIEKASAQTEAGRLIPCALNAQLHNLTIPYTPRIHKSRYVKSAYLVPFPSRCSEVGAAMTAIRVAPSKQFCALVRIGELVWESDTADHAGVSKTTPPRRLALA